MICRILLGGWLTCLFAVRADDPATNAISIPVSFSHGRAVLSARIHDSKPLSFLLDTGCTIPTLHPTLVDELGLESSGQLTINGIAGNERAPTYRGVKFDLGGATYAPRRVASIPSERQERRRRDGVVGSGFFKQFVVEIDARHKTVRLHSPTNFAYSGPGQVVPFYFKSEIPVIKASVLLTNNLSIEGEFEVDTGCDSGLCLGDSFVKKHRILEQIETRSDEKFGVGGSIETRNGKVPTFRVGSLDIKNAQADFFVNGSPVDDPLAGHIGVGVLNRYKVFYDYSRKQLILEE